MDMSNQWENPTLKRDTELETIYVMIDRDHIQKHSDVEEYSFTMSIDHRNELFIRSKNGRTATYAYGEWIAFWAEEREAGFNFIHGLTPIGYRPDWVPSASW